MNDVITKPTAKARIKTKRPRLHKVILLNRCRYRGEDGMKRWVGLGVIADNLINIGHAIGKPAGQIGRHRTQGPPLFALPTGIARRVESSCSNHATPLRQKRILRRKVAIPTEKCYDGGDLGRVGLGLVMRTSREPSFVHSALCCKQDRRNGAPPHPG